MTGFEPATTRPPDAYSTGLSYIPFFFYGCKGKIFPLYTKTFTVKIQRFQYFLFRYLLIYLNITDLRK
jgi:hypothetical protein